MALTKTYDPDFERIWEVYPKWPKGRSKKHMAAKAFKDAKKEFAFTSEDIDRLVADIEQAKRDRASWQPGNEFGPQGLQVWLNQRAWQDEYQRVQDNRRKPDKYDRANQEFEARQRANRGSHAQAY